MSAQLWRAPETTEKASSSPLLSVPRETVVRLSPNSEGLMPTLRMPGTRAWPYTLFPQHFNTQWSLYYHRGGKRTRGTGGGRGTNNIKRLAILYYYICPIHPIIVLTVIQMGSYCYQYVPRSCNNRVSDKMVGMVDNSMPRRDETALQLRSLSRSHLEGCQQAAPTW